MPDLDARVASILDHADPDPDSDDSDALLAALEAEDDSAFRAQRLQQLSAELSRSRAARASGSGTHTSLADEKAVLDLTTNSARAVVHFLKPDFARCGVMEAALAGLAGRHFEVRFGSVDVERAPFLVERLRVRVLPCVLAFVDGVVVDRIVGFEGVGRGEDGFTLGELEGRLLRSGVLLRAKVVEGEGQAGRWRAKREDEVEDDGDDWD